MAITKIHPIKSTIQRSIDYICNPHKTDDQLLMATFACSHITAGLDFEDALSHASNTIGANKAFHLIQSFAPGEVSFDECHVIGKELADRLLEGKYSYVLTTHINKEHYHNHLIFCAVNNINQERYYDTKSSYKHIRELSDNLCKEHGLSIVIPSGRKGKSYAEWSADKDGYSIKATIKMDITNTIRIAKSYDDFILKMKNLGYEIKGYEVGEDKAKYISFKAPGYDKYIRGSYKNFGKGYTKEEIFEKINKRIESRNLWIEKQKNIDMSEKELINLNQDKFKDNEYLKRWADTTNLQIAAATYAKTSSLYETDSTIEELKVITSDTRKAIKDIDQKMLEINELYKYKQQYESTLEYHQEYTNSNDKEGYLRLHETKLLLYDSASQYFQNKGLNPEAITIDYLAKQYKNLENERTRLNEVYSKSSNELNELRSSRNKIHNYLSKEDKDQSL